MCLNIIAHTFALCNAFGQFPIYTIYKLHVDTSLSHRCPPVKMHITCSRLSAIKVNHLKKYWKSHWLSSRLPVIWWRNQISFIIKKSNQHISFTDFLFFIFSVRWDIFVFKIIKAKECRLLHLFVNDISYCNILNMYQYQRIASHCIYMTMSITSLWYCWMNGLGYILRSTPIGLFTLYILNSSSKSSHWHGTSWHIWYGLILLADMCSTYQDYLLLFIHFMTNWKLLVTISIHQFQHFAIFVIFFFFKKKPHTFVCLLIQCLINVLLRIETSWNCVEKRKQLKHEVDMFIWIKNNRIELSQVLVLI